ncbi:branched-chain amino acid ABC transporter permease [bacterium]|nr:branched-chain amino acid ABC transporter permease [bacterium]
MDIVPQIIVNSIVAGSLYALIAMSFNLIYGVTRFFNLAHGAIAAVGGYGAYAVLHLWNGSVFLAILFGILCAGIVAFSLDKIVYMPLRARRASQMVLLVASLGVFTVMQAVLAILFGSVFRSLSNKTPDTYAFFGTSGIITETHIFMIAIAILAFAALYFTLKATLWGRAVRAISDDSEVAKMVGIDTDAITGQVFFAGSAIAGLAGILVGFDTGLEPTMGLLLLLKGIIAAIVGGIGSVSGAFVGAFLLGFAENFGILYVAAEWKDAIAFGLLIVFLLWRPRGLIS